MTEFVVGQYVELYPQSQSESGVDMDAGTRGIVQAVDLTRPSGDVYRVEFLQNEKLTGQRAWLRAIDLFPA